MQEINLYIEHFSVSIRERVGEAPVRILPFAQTQEI